MNSKHDALPEILGAQLRERAPTVNDAIRESLVTNMWGPGPIKDLSSVEILPRIGGPIIVMNADKVARVNDYHGNGYTAVVVPATQMFKLDDKTKETVKDASIGAVIGRFFSMLLGG